VRALRAGAVKLFACWCCFVVAVGSVDGLRV